MIALDPEFVGRLAPESKLTTRAEMLREKNSGEGQGGKGKKEGEVPFARMSRMERLSVAGKMDLSEVVGSDDEDVGGDEGGDGQKEGGERGRRKESKEEREKRKMRGKGKSLKRYLRKQRKNVVDPAAVGFSFSFSFLVSFCYVFYFVSPFPSYHISFFLLFAASPGANAVFYSLQLAIRAKLEKQKEEKKRARLAATAAAAGGDGEPAKKKSALDRFKRST